MYVRAAAVKPSAEAGFLASKNLKLRPRLTRGAEPEIAGGLCCVGTCERVASAIPRDWLDSRVSQGRIKRTIQRSPTYNHHETNSERYEIYIVYCGFGIHRNPNLH